jgi:hypothetical protein
MITMRADRPGVVTVSYRACQIGERLMIGDEGCANGNSFGLERRPGARAVPCWKFGISIESMMAGALRGGMA